MGEKGVSVWTHKERLARISPESGCRGRSYVFEHGDCGNQCSVSESCEIEDNR